MSKRYSSELVSGSLRFIYPFIVMFGFYMILNGHNSPGGGFQGGAVLTAVFVTRYLIFPTQTIRIDGLRIVEKLVFIMILLVPMFFLFTFLNIRYPALNVYYLVLMNVLIGIKVFCGLGIVFFRFVYYESE